VIDPFKVSWTHGPLVDADEGIAIIPSFGLPVCRKRKVLMSELINAVVNVEFHQICNRGEKLPPGAGRLHRL
jgi:hypothetical protein